MPSGKGDIGIVKSFIAEDVDAKEKNASGTTLLHERRNRDWRDFATLLIERGAHEWKWISISCKEMNAIEKVFIDNSSDNMSFIFCGSFLRLRGRGRRSA